MLKKLFQRKQFVGNFLLASAGLGLLIVGAFAFLNYYSTTHEGPTYPLTDIVTETTTVSEKPIEVSDSGYKVPANQPRTIEISGIGVKGYVQRVGIDRDGLMSTPNNINFAGWYAKSVAPGEDGLSIINGHVGGKYTRGLFSGLKSLKENDTIRIQMGDLSWRKFSVVSVKTYPVEQAASPLFATDPKIQRELHLITCDGVFDEASQSYNSRTIVVAKYV
ncbi:MAG: class F sortase [Candidatus Saccharimonadaceae bacterium]